MQEGAARAQHVDTLACEGHDGLAVSFAFRSLAVVVAAGLVTAADADQHGGVEDALEASAVAGGPVQVAADLSGVACDGGDADEPVGAVEGIQVSAGGGEELGSQQRPDTGHAGDHFGMAVLAKPAR